MSNRRAKRERSEIRNRGRLRYLLAVLELEDLQRVGVVPKEFAEKPNASAIERMLDQRLAIFRKADARLRKKQELPQPAVMMKSWDAISGKWVPVIGESRARFDPASSEIKGKEVTKMFVDELHEISALPE